MVHLATYLPIYLSIYVSIYLSIYLSLSLFHLSLCLAVYLSICLCIYLSIYRSISLFHLSLCLASKGGRRPPVFNTFDFRMCFAPQRRALFRHLDFQKWSGPGVFCTFWLGNVLRATTACTFSTSQLPKVVRTWCVLDILTWKCASRHNHVPSGATNHWKNTVFRDFPTFSRICIFFLLTLSLLWSSLF